MSKSRIRPQSKKGESNVQGIEKQNVSNVRQVTGSSTVSVQQEIKSKPFTDLACPCHNFKSHQLTSLSYTCTQLFELGLRTLKTMGIWVERQAQAGMRKCTLEGIFTISKFIIGLLISCQFQHSILGCYSITPNNFI